MKISLQSVLFCLWSKEIFKAIKPEIQDFQGLLLSPVFCVGMVRIYFCHHADFCHQVLFLM